MPERVLVMRALHAVQDPELHKSIVDLGMVRDLNVEGGAVRFTLALTTLSCPLRDRIADDARRAILELDQVNEVTVDLREMTPAERERIWPRPEQGEGKTRTAGDVNRIDRVVAVMSGKGGVGKSSVTALLAVALRRQGKRIAILDADITGPSIPRIFGLRASPAPSPLGMLPVESESGIEVMSINLLLPSEDQPVIWRGPLIGKVIKQFWDDVVWGDVDVMLLDLPPGTSDASLTVMQSIPLSGIVLVTSPQDLAGMIVRKAASMAASLQVPVVGLIENMSYAVCPRCGDEIRLFGPGESEKMADNLNACFLGHLPIDPQLAARCDMGAIEGYDSPLITEAAERLLAVLPDSKTTPSF